MCKCGHFGKFHVNGSGHCEFGSSTWRRYPKPDSHLCQCQKYQPRPGR